MSLPPARPGEPDPDPAPLPVVAPPAPGSARPAGARRRRVRHSLAATLGIGAVLATAAVAHAGAGGDGFLPGAPRPSDVRPPHASAPRAVAAHRTVSVPRAVAGSWTVAATSRGVQVGSFVAADGATVGFVHRGGAYHFVRNPRSAARPMVDRLVGIDEHGIAVGFYLDRHGKAHAYRYDVRRGTFRPVPGSGHDVIQGGMAR